jgi:hypothetical protein
VTDKALERALEELDIDGGGPPADWQERVAARIEVPPAPRRARWPFLAAGSGLIVTAAAVALFVALRAGRDTPPPPPANRAAYDRLMRDIDRLEAEAQYQQALRAVTEAERAEAEEALSLAKRKREAAEKLLDQAKRKARKSDGESIAVKCDPADPLCGVN